MITYGAMEEPSGPIAALSVPVGMVTRPTPVQSDCPRTTPAPDSYRPRSAGRAPSPVAGSPRTMALSTHSSQRRAISLPVPS